VKGRISPLTFKGVVIATIIPEPQRQEDDCDKRAVNDSRDRKIEHRSNASLRATRSAATKEKRADGESARLRVRD